MMTVHPGQELSSRKYRNTWWQCEQIDVNTLI